MRVIRCTIDIPEDIYIQIPFVIYNSYESMLKGLSRYATKLVTNKIEKPVSGDKITVGTHYRKYIIYKSENDPFDVEYQIMCRIKSYKLNDTLSKFLSKSHLDFSLHRLEDKNLFFAYISLTFSKWLDQQIRMQYDFDYIDIKAIVLFNTEDKIINV